MSKTFLFQVNVTRDCNLRCTHCYISSEKKDISKMMSAADIIMLFQQIQQYLMSETAKRHGYTYAEIHIIGGEPTLLGLELFQNIVPEINSLLSQQPIPYRLSIVSNLVSKEALQVARLFENVSTSYEVDTRFISIKHIVKPQLETKWLQNVRVLQDEGKDIAITMAVTKNAIEMGAARVLNYFYENGFRKIHLGFFIPSGDGRKHAAAIGPTFAETSEFLIEATDWYLSHRNEDEGLFLNPIESLIDAIYKGEPSDDIVCPIIPGSLDVDWDGETVTCIEAGGETDMVSLGNVFASSVTDVLNGPKYLRERAKAIRPQPLCVGCDEITLCQSACGILHKTWDGEDECPGFKRSIKYVRRHVEQGVLPKSLVTPFKEGC